MIYLKQEWKTWASNQSIGSLIIRIKNIPNGDDIPKMGMTNMGFESKNTIPYYKNKE